MDQVGLLVNPPLFWGPLKNRISFYEATRRSVVTAEALADYPGEHLGLQSIAAYCRHRGQPVTVINGIALEHVSVEQTFEAMVASVRTSGVPRLIGLSGTSVAHNASRALAKRCKESWPDARIILGYDFATLNYDRLMREDANIDFVCRGEGERVFSTVLERLMNGGAVDDIPGLAYRASGGAVVANEPAAANVNDLPWPARDDLPRVLAAGFGSAVYASRGCPYRCNYCAMGETSALFGKDAYRLRDIEAVVEEMAFLRRDHGVPCITIIDDLFLTRSPSSHARAEAFASLLIKRNLGLHWMMDCRVDSIEPKLFQHLHASGLRKVFVGVETPDAEQLASYNKRYLLKQEKPQDRLRHAIDAGITVVPGILTYHPHSTLRELKAILKFVDDVGWEGKYQLMNRVRAYPGTPLYEQYKREGLLKPGTTWPNEEWIFSDPRVERISMLVSREAMRPETSFEKVRDLFAREVAALEVDAVSHLGPLDAEGEAAIAAGLETAGGGDEG